MGLKSYRPEIDGLRACAVIPVILFHLDSLWIKGGYIGVDVFFVISGFLITSIILDEHDGSAFKFSNFWLRRIRRILPALLAMLIVSSLAACFLSFRPDLFIVGKHGIAAALSFANFMMMSAGNYWGDIAEHSLFLHTWSLSVEEQFYLLYPFITYGLIKLGRKWLGRGIALIAALSFAAYLIGSTRYSVATFYMLPTRAWELASGCLAAIAKWNGKPRASRRLSSALSVLGLALIIASYFLVEGDNRYVGSLLVPVLGAVGVIVFGEGEGSPAKRVLSLPPMVYVGKISYSLYLWHWPVLVLGRQTGFLDGSLLADAAALAAIALLSVLSYNFVEKPTRHRRKILVPAFCALAASLAVSTALYTQNFSYDCSMYGKVTWMGQVYNVNPVDDWNREIRKRMEGVEVPTRAAGLDRAYLDGGIIHYYGQARPEVVVLGDSHALMWAKAIDEVCAEQRRTVSFYCADATTPFTSIPPVLSGGTQFMTSEQRLAFSEAKLRYLAEWKPALVIVVARWSLTPDMKDDGPLLRFIGGLGSRVLLIEQPPELPFGNRNAMQYLAFRKIRPIEGGRRYIEATRSPEYERGRALLRQAASELPFCSFMEVDDVLRKGDSEALALDGSKVTYIDDNHLSLDGTLILKDRLSKAIAAGASLAEHPTSP
jgi:peptidoglycan/LPS O-acetylase OafA/YrhL